MRTIQGTFFESKVRREALTEDGTQAKINSLYVIDAMSFSECEARVTDFVAQYANGDFEVLTETRAPYKEIIFAEGCELWYRVKVAFITLNEKTGKQKKTKEAYLVQADTIDGAKKNFDEMMKGSVIDYVIEGIHETAIEDIVERDVNNGE